MSDGESDYKDDNPKDRGARGSPNSGAPLKVPVTAQQGECVPLMQGGLAQGFSGLEGGLESVVSDGVARDLGNEASKDFSRGKNPVWLKFSRRLQLSMGWLRFK